MFNTVIYSIKHLIRTLNRSSEPKKSRNLNLIVNIFELENIKQVVRGIEIIFTAILKIEERLIEF